MIPRIEKTVFISYRRTDLPWAVVLYQNLTSKGYDVFFDYNSIRSGDFEQIITQNIRGRAHFVVLLTPSALEKCNEPNDWLRREIELAIDSKRNIVPVLFDGFSFGNPSLSKYLTGKLSLLKKYNGMTVPAEYIEESMARLRKDFLSVPLIAVLHPISSEVQKVVEEQQSVANKVDIYSAGICSFCEQQGQPDVIGVRPYCSNCGQPWIPSAQSVSQSSKKVDIQPLGTCSFCAQKGQPTVIGGKPYCSNCGQPWIPSVKSPSDLPNDELSEFSCRFCGSTNPPVVLSSGNYCSDCGSQV